MCVIETNSKIQTAAEMIPLGIVPKAINRCLSRIVDFLNGVPKHIKTNIEHDMKTRLAKFQIVMHENELRLSLVVTRYES